MREIELNVEVAETIYDIRKATPDDHFEWCGLLGLWETQEFVIGFAIE